MSEDLTKIQEMLKNLSPENLEGLAQLVEEAGAAHQLWPDVEPRYAPNSCSVEDVKNLFEWVVDVGMTFLNDGEFAASGMAWNMVETLSLIIADANELAYRVYELTGEVRDANDHVQRLQGVIGDLQSD